MKRVRTYSELSDRTSSDIAGQLAAREGRLRRRLSSVSHIFAVLSGKGGVGKSIVTANLATALASDGLAVGVLDVDLNGPSQARLLGAESAPLRVMHTAVEPAVGALGVKVMSMGLLLERDDAPLDWVGPSEGSFVWRGLLEVNALSEFLSDTEWGELDYLILDLPPGTDRIAPVHDLLPNLGAAVVVTLPSDLSRFIVRKSLTMSRELGIPIIGYVENMAGYLCPHCGRMGSLFEAEAGSFEGTRRLASVPFDPVFGRNTDAGRPDVIERPDSEVAVAIRAIASAVRTFFEGEGS